MTLILSNDEVDRLLTMEDCLEALEPTYRDLATGQAINRPRSDVYAPGEREDALYVFKTMDGVVPRFGTAALRLNSDVITWPKVGGAVRKEKVPAATGNKWVGLILLFSTRNGEPLAIMPDGVLQRMRVGATNGLGVKYLAREDSSVVGLLGTGWQAPAQAMAVCAVRKVKLLKVYSPNPQHRADFVGEMGPKLGTEVQAVESAREAFQGSHVVMVSTNAMEPTYDAGWLEPGVHLSSIKRWENPKEAFFRSDVVMIHFRTAEPENYVIGNAADWVPDLAAVDWSSPAAGVIPWQTYPELGEVMVGRAQGRGSDRQITFFMNNVGLGIQFAAVGARVYELARENGVGHEIPTDWFLETVHP